MIKGVKKFAITFLIFCISAGAAANAQIMKPGVTLGINAVYSMPKNWFKEAYNFGIGGEVYGGIGLGKSYLIATLGYSAFKEDVSLNAETLTYTPVKVGIKQMFLLKKLFIQGDVGAASVKYGGVSENAFTAGAGAGVRLAGLELSLYYDAFKAKRFDKYANTLNAKLGYSFSF